MALDLRRPPVDVLHMPSIHTGMQYVGKRPEWLIRKANTADVRLHAASEHDELRKKQQSMNQRLLQQLPVGAIEVRSCPVVLKDARFFSGLVALSERLWLNGASGGRARIKFQDQNREEWRANRVQGAMRRSRSSGRNSIGTCARAEADALDVAIELKNGFNYYHFSTETLGSLSHFVEDETGRDFTLHLPRGDIKSFVRNFVTEIFPEIAERVRFEARPRRYDQVRSIYSHQHYLYLVDDLSINAAVTDGSIDASWSGFVRDPARMKLVAMQSYDTSLRKLRAAALTKAREGKTSGAGRLIWMGRDEGGAARIRGLEGHEPLLEELMGRGFEQVAFEHLSPVGQVAAMNEADVVIAPHGAGLANMMYANSRTTVIEIGTRQTQLHRWGDFLKCAHVAGCRYDTVFADIKGVDEPGYVPPIASGLRGIRIGPRAIESIIGILDEVTPSAVRAGA